MGLFGKKAFVLEEGVYNTVIRCTDSQGRFEIQQFRDAVRSAEEQLSSPQFSANRAHHGAEMRAFASELRSVLNWFEANLGRPFTIQKR